MVGFVTPVTLAESNSIFLLSVLVVVSLEVLSNKLVCIVVEGVVVAEDDEITRVPSIL